MIAEVGGLAKKDADKEEEKKKADDGKEMKKKTKSGSGAKLVQEEKRETGGIAWSVLKAYIDAFGGCGIAFLFIGLLILNQIVNSLRSVFMSQWSEAGTNKTFPIFRHFTQSEFIVTYAGFQFLAILFVLVISFYSKHLGIKASHAMHGGMLKSVFRAPMQFFHANTLGRLINRFSKDIADLDKNTMPNMMKFVQSVFKLVGSLIVMCTTTVYTSAVVAPVFFMVYELYILGVLVRFVFFVCSRAISTRSRSWS